MECSRAERGKLHEQLSSEISLNKELHKNEKRKSQISIAHFSFVESERAS